MTLALEVDAAAIGDRYLNVAEAAVFLATTRWRIYSLVKAGRLRAGRLGGQLRFTAADLHALVTTDDGTAEPRGRSPAQLAHLARARQAAALAKMQARKAKRTGKAGTRKAGGR